jgi:hypothetical protein
MIQFVENPRYAQPMGRHLLLAGIALPASLDYFTYSDHHGPLNRALEAAPWVQGCTVLFTVVTLGVRAQILNDTEAYIEWCREWG